MAKGSGCSMEGLEPRAMLAADSVTNNHPLWVVPRTSAAIALDGRLDEAAWDLATPIERSLASLPDYGVSLRMLYTADALKVGAEIRDPAVFADGNGGGPGGTGDRWQYYNDDALTLYFDVNEGRSASALPAAGRVLSLNAAPFGSRTSGQAPVWRWDFLKGDPGDAATGSRPVNADGSLPPGLVWKTRVDGTLRRTGDTDRGWSVEISIPWSALGLRQAPADGRTMGMNFQVFYDNNGRGIDTSDGVPEFATSVRYDAKLLAVPSSLELDPRNGWPRPVGYAAAQFSDPGAAHAPTAIDDLTVTNVDGYGAVVEFTSPAATAAAAKKNKGHVAGYQVRLSGSPITTEADWNAAAPVANAFVPKLRGLGESLRLAELTPGSTYYVSVRGVDAAGRVGALSRSVSFTTLTAQEDPSGGARVIVAPDGTNLITESGAAFPMIGGTVGIHNLYVRGLYSGGVWAGNPPRLVDFSLPQNHREGEAVDYFRALAATGVNVLRLQLEWLVKPGNVSDQQLTASLPDGLRWLEWRNQGARMSRFNPEMRTFLLRAMDAAHEAGIRFMLQTSNNFNYENNFDLTPFAASRGGPIGSIDQFFDNPKVKEMTVRRLKVLADWVNSSEHPETVMGMELYNEWDAVKRPGGMGNAAFADYRRSELTRRAQFLADVSRDIKGYAPNLLVFSSTIGTEPDGVVARSLFYSDTFDVLDPHYYAPAVSQPVLNPDADKTVRVARDYGAIAAYWLNNRRDHRPVHNGEWNLSSGFRLDWPNDRVEYSPRFTLQEDEANYRVASWTAVASGLAGAGWRIGSSPLTDIFPGNPRPNTTGILTVPLSPAMRATQREIADFFASDSAGFDWATFRPRSLWGHISASGEGQRVVAVGSADDVQGLAYVVRDSTLGATGSATLRIDSLAPGTAFNFEVWTASAAADAASRLLTTLEARTDGEGRVLLTLPEFARDLVIRFRIGAAA